MRSLPMLHIPLAFLVVGAFLPPATGAFVDVSASLTTQAEAQVSLVVRTNAQHNGCEVSVTYSGRAIGDGPFYYWAEWPSGVYRGAGPVLKSGSTTTLWQMEADTEVSFWTKAFIYNNDLLQIDRAEAIASGSAYCPGPGSDAKLSCTGSSKAISQAVPDEPLKIQVNLAAGPLATLVCGGVSGAIGSK